MNLYNVIIQDDEEDVLAHALVRTRSTDNDEIAAMVADDHGYDEEQRDGWSWTVAPVLRPDREGVLNFGDVRRGEFCS